MSPRLQLPPAFALAAVAALALLAGCDQNTSQAAAPAHTPAAAAASAPSSSPSVVKVDPSLVCMVNNQFMGKPQIPVSVGDITYYGCCEMCKTKLANDPASRLAVDPISGKQVDKAAAVIGRKSSGAVVYFESEANLNAFASANSGS